MEFITVSTFTDAFHYASNLEDKQKGQAHFATKSIGEASDKKSPFNSNKSRHPSELTPPK